MRIDCLSANLSAVNCTERERDAPGTNRTGLLEGLQKATFPRAFGAFAFHVVCIVLARGGGNIFPVLVIVEIHVEDRQQGPGSLPTHLHWKRVRFVPGPFLSSPRLFQQYMLSEIIKHPI